MNRQQHIRQSQRIISSHWKNDAISANDGASAYISKVPTSEHKYRSTTERKITERGIPTGFPALDQALPWQGLPTRGLIEIVCAQRDMTELQLLLPALQQRSQGSQSLLWITPPYSPHGESLRQSGINLRNSFIITAQTQCNQALWSIEKALQSKECSMVLAWQNWLSARVLRRLELAARHGGTLGVVFHRRAQLKSPSTLQLEVSVSTDLPSGKRVLDVAVRQVCGQPQNSRHRLIVS